MIIKGLNIEVKLKYSEDQSLDEHVLNLIKDAGLSESEGMTVYDSIERHNQELIEEYNQFLFDTGVPLPKLKG